VPRPAVKKANDRRQQVCGLSGEDHGEDLDCWTSSYAAVANRTLGRLAELRGSACVWLCMPQSAGAIIREADRPVVRQFPLVRLYDCTDCTDCDHSE
jgi:hypothetical protein